MPKQFVKRKTLSVFHCNRRKDDTKINKWSIPDIPNLPGYLCDISEISMIFRKFRDIKAFLS